MPMIVFEAQLATRPLHKSGELGPKRLRYFFNRKSIIVDPQTEPQFCDSANVSSLQRQNAHGPTKVLFGKAPDRVATTPSAACPAWGNQALVDPITHHTVRNRPDPQSSCDVIQRANKFLGLGRHRLGQVTTPTQIVCRIDLESESIEASLRGLYNGSLPV